MKEAFFFNQGIVTKYSSNKKERIKRFHLYQFIYILSFFVCFLTTHFIFKLCISNEYKLSDTIALGSIFATFGSSIVAIFTLTLSNIYERFCNNLSILFTKLSPENEWHRWPFIKRVSHSKLYNHELTYQVLKNSEIVFNVGSHLLTIILPTVKEDFYDLANWSSYLNMFRELKNYESFVLNNITEPANSLMLWDCIFDNFKCIAIYKFARLMIIIGESFIFSSIILAFFYTKIPF